MTHPGMNFKTMLLSSRRLPKRDPDIILEEPEVFQEEHKIILDFNASSARKENRKLEVVEW